VQKFNEPFIHSSIDNGRKLEWKDCKLSCRRGHGAVSLKMLQSLKVT